MIIGIDFHGVLTNGKIGVAADGKTYYEYVHTKDISAIRELIARGNEVYVVTSSSSEIIDAYCNKVGCQKIQDRTKLNVFKEPYIFIGDSSYDYNILANAHIAFCPADAELLLLNDKNIITLESKGGEGCVAEVLRYLYAHNINNSDAN